MNEQLTALKFTGQVLFEKTYEWYEYRQNNSGGSFIQNDDVSITVLIQAASTKEADTKAEDIGIYFDGCSDGRDCDCCGDRWNRAWDAMDSFVTHKDFRSPRVEHTNVRDYAQALADNDTWAGNKPPVIIYFADGTVERFYKTKKGN
jgi:hypothetical protein